MSSQIFGNLFAAFLFKNYSIIGFYISMVGCVTLGWIILALIGDPEVAPRGLGDDTPLRTADTVQ
jgi:hypothetical protein